MTQLDVAVTVIEPRATFLDFVDKEVIDEFVHQLRDRGVTFRLGSPVAKVERANGGIATTTEDGRSVKTEMLPRLRIAHKGRVANYEWLDAIDLLNMIEAAELIVHSSRERHESRGPFMRRDFPAMDNQGWLAANVMIKTDNGFRFERRPYELPFLKPDFAVKDNLEVPW